MVWQFSLVLLIWLANLPVWTIRIQPVGSGIEYCQNHFLSPRFALAGTLYIWCITSEGLQAMKVICDRAALVDAVNIAGGVVVSRTPTPVLTCVKLTATEGQLSLAATDLEVGVR